MLAVTLATLTGASRKVAGHFSMSGMRNDPASELMDIMKSAGNEVFERIIEFPLWEEYGEMLKSDVADLKNVGGEIGGMITAGKFLEHFTDYPFIHLDIAGPAFIKSNDKYRPKGGTGWGVRILSEFIGQLEQKLGS
jgi:leucyl aminopeptidase